MRYLFIRLIHRLRQIIRRLKQCISSTILYSSPTWCTMESCTAMECDGIDSNDIHRDTNNNNAATAIDKLSGVPFVKYDDHAFPRQEADASKNRGGISDSNTDVLIVVGGDNDEGHSSSHGYYYQQKDSLLTPLLKDSHQKQQRFVILDLDETIVSTKNSHRHPHYDHFTITFEYPSVLVAHVSEVETRHSSSTTTQSTTSFVTYTVHIRPHTISFLKCCLEHDIDLVVFSAGQFNYVHAVCDQLFGLILGRRPCKIFTYDDMHTDPHTLRRSKKLDTILGVLGTHRQHVWVLDDASYNYLDLYDDERVLRIPAWDVDRLPMAQHQQYEHLNSGCRSSLSVSSNTGASSMSVAPVSSHHEDDWLWWAWLRMAHDWNLTTPSHYVHHIPTHASTEDVIFAWDIMSMTALQQQQQHSQNYIVSTSASTSTYHQRHQASSSLLLDATYDAAFSTNNTMLTSDDDWTYYSNITDNIFHQASAMDISSEEQQPESDPMTVEFENTNTQAASFSSKCLSWHSHYTGTNDVSPDNAQVSLKNCKNEPDEEDAVEEEEENAVDEDENMQAEENSLTDDDAISEMMMNDAEPFSNIRFGVCSTEWTNINKIWPPTSRGLTTTTLSKDSADADEESSSALSTSSSESIQSHPSEQGVQECLKRDNDGCESLALSVSSINVKESLVKETKHAVLPYINIYNTT